MTRLSFGRRANLYFAATFPGAAAPSPRFRATNATRASRPQGLAPWSIGSPAIALIFFVLLVALPLHAADVATLFAERLKSVVAVEYYTETESDRSSTISYGTVIDGQGTIILPSVAINARVAPTQLKDFKVYLPGGSDGTPATYLGQDALTGWHFVRADPSIRGQLVPVTTFAAKQPADPALAEELWGIGLRNKDEDFTPYVLTSHVALVQRLPQKTAIAQQEVAGPGLPVFNRAGEFEGLALSSFGQNYVQFSRDNRAGMPVIQVNVEESGAVLVAAEVLPYLGRIPHNLFGRPLAWLGAYGLETMDPEAAKFLKLGKQSAVVVSEVIAGSPAAAAGLKDRDILVGIDGTPLPRLKPDQVVVNFIGREIERRHPGDAITFTVLRGTERSDIKVTLGEQPKLFGEAERKYFDRIGLTAREFVYEDAVARRADPTELTGVVAHYVKPNGAAAIAGLRTDDWIKEIDGEPVKTFAEATDRLALIDGDRTRTECVLLVSRNGETAVLRVKL